MIAPSSMLKLFVRHYSVVYKNVNRSYVFRATKPLIWIGLFSFHRRAFAGAVTHSSSSALSRSTGKPTTLLYDPEISLMIRWPSS
jgi:hypothetical protein